jgi:hypothetical protein
LDQFRLNFREIFHPPPSPPPPPPRRQHKPARPCFHCVFEQSRWHAKEDNPIETGPKQSPRRAVLAVSTEFSGRNPQSPTSTPTPTARTSAVFTCARAVPCLFDTAGCTHCLRRPAVRKKKIQSKLVQNSPAGAVLDQFRWNLREKSSSRLTLHPPLHLSTPTPPARSSAALPCTRAAPTASSNKVIRHLPSTVSA